MYGANIESAQLNTGHTSCDISANAATHFSRVVFM